MAEITRIIFNGLFCVFAILLVYFFIVKYVVRVFCPYMMNQYFDWDKTIDKPRILFNLSFFFCFIYFLSPSLIELDNLKLTESMKEVIDNLIFWIFLLGRYICCFALFFSWKPWFKDAVVPKFEKIVAQTAKHTSITSDEKIMNRLLQKMTLDYIQETEDSKDAFSCFIHQTSLGENSKLIWKHVHNGQPNKQTLLEWNCN